MSDILTRLQQAREDGDWRTVMNAVPYNQTLGFDLEIRGGELMGIMRYKPELVGNASIPALHGGTLASLLESTALSTVLWATDCAVLPRTVSITFDFLRPAKPIDTFARATVTRKGRRVVSARVEAWQEDRERLVAAAHGHFLIS